MHDFIQTLSFQAQHSPAFARTATEVLRSVMRSFDSEVAFTSYRPIPRAKSARPVPRKSQVTSRKS
jgi:hypothetical protein